MERPRRRIAPIVIAILAGAIMFGTGVFVARPSDPVERDVACAYPGPRMDTRSELELRRKLLELEIDRLRLEIRLLELPDMQGCTDELLSRDATAADLRSLRMCLEAAHERNDRGSELERLRRHKAELDAKIDKL